MFPIFKLFVCFLIQCEPIRKNVLGYLSGDTAQYSTVLLYQPLKNIMHTYKKYVTF